MMLIIATIDDDLNICITKSWGGGSLVSQRGSPVSKGGCLFVAAPIASSQNPPGSLGHKGLGKYAYSVVMWDVLIRIFLGGRTGGLGGTRVTASGRRKNRGKKDSSAECSITLLTTERADDCLNMLHNR